MSKWKVQCRWMFQYVTKFFSQMYHLYIIEKPQNSNFAYFAKCVFFWQYRTSHMQYPKLFSPVLQRATFGLIILRKAIFWEPWQNVFSDHKNVVKNANFQVCKTYNVARSQNGIRPSCGNSKIILVQV